MSLRTALSIVALPLVAVACGGRAYPTQFPSGESLPLFEGPIHLGNDDAGGQAFTSGRALAARACSLITVPHEMNAFLQVQNIRMTETLSDQLVVNGKAYPLPVTLERDPWNRTSNATSASPVQPIHLDKGPSEICLVAGLMTVGGLDDFEADQVILFVEDTKDIYVRKGLTLGQPPPSQPPSVPWGEKQ